MVQPLAFPVRQFITAPLNFTLSFLKVRPDISRLSVDNVCAKQSAMQNSGPTDNAKAVNL